MLQFTYNNDDTTFWFRFSAWPDGAIEVAPYEELAEFLDLLLNSGKITHIEKRNDFARP